MSAQPVAGLTCGAMTEDRAVLRVGGPSDFLLSPVSFVLAALYRPLQIHDLLDVGVQDGRG